MANHLSQACVAILLGCASSPGTAQMDAPPIPSALPDVSSISAGNAAGVIQYCRQHELVSISVSDMILSQLTANPNVAKSADYATGVAGNIVTGGKRYSIGSATPYLQSQACDRVMRQAEQFK